MVRRFVFWGLVVSFLLQAGCIWENEEKKAGAKRAPIRLPVAMALRAAQKPAAVEDALVAINRLAERTCLATAIYYEARGETVSGQKAVAMVIFNTTEAGRLHIRPAFVAWSFKMRAGAIAASFHSPAQAFHWCRKMPKPGSSHSGSPRPDTPAHPNATITRWSTKPTIWPSTPRITMPIMSAPDGLNRCTGMARSGDTSSCRPGPPTESESAAAPCGSGFC